MATILDQLKVILGIETKGFDATRSVIKNFTGAVDRDLSSIKNAIGGYFTASVVKELVRGGMELADRWHDAAERLGETTDEVQRIDAAFRKVGLSVEIADRAFAKIVETRKKALEGGQDEMNLFQGFGISEKQLRENESGSSLFRLMSERAEGNPEAFQKFTEFFGARQGGRMLAAGRAMREGVDANIIPEEDLKQLHDSNIALTEAMIDLKISAASWTAAILQHLSRDPTGQNTADNYNRISELRNQAKGILSSGKATDQSKKFAKEFISRTGGTGLYAWSRFILGLGQSGDINSDVNPETLETYAKMFQTGGAGKSFKALRPKVSKPVTTTDTYSPGSEQQKEIDQKMQDVLDKTFLKISNSTGKRAIITSEIQRKTKEASDLEAKHKWKEAAQVRQEIVGLAAERVAIDADKRLSFSADSRAAVGGFIGGATSAIDPGLLAAQDQVRLLNQILSQVDGISKYIKPNASARLSP